MTARDLITNSLRLIGALANNETPSANEANNSLQSLNDMLDLWSTQKLLINASIQETFSFVGNQQTYTMGVGGNFNTARPQRIEQALYQQTTGATLLNLPIQLIDQDEFTALPVPNVQSTIPTKLFVNYTNPLATLYFWPVPSTAGILVLWSWKTLSTFATLDTTVILPPGYNKALRYNLGVELAPEYGKQVDDIVLAQAVDSKADIKRMNSKILLMSQDSALISRSAKYNYLTGE